MGGGGENADRTDPRRFVNIHDDFAFGSSEDGEIGELGWRTANIGGDFGAAFRSEPAVGAGNRYGEIGVRGGVGSGAGAFGIYGGGEWFTTMGDGLPVGATMYARLFAPSAAGQVVWCGLAGAHQTPTTAASTPFLGFRQDAAVDGNVYAVVKDGADADDEDVSSLGALDTTNWATYVVHRRATNTFDFSTGSGGTRVTIETTNFSAVGTVEWVIGCAATGGADKSIHVDFFGVDFPLDRR